jgi:general secretion pathway protein K
MRRTQSGVALVIALLVVALATVLIAGLLDRGELAAARTRNLLRTEQADAYARGLEQYAARVLLKDAEQGDGDSNSDMWAMPLPPTPVPGGRISAQLRDLNGCFNLNNLVSGDSSQPEWRARFARLLTALRLDPTLTEVVVDWIDKDGEPGGGGGHGSGAEDGAYAAAQPSYRAANRQFSHVSELRLLQGFDSRVYAALQPHVCALPPRSLLNVNTASVAVLQSLDARITEEMARRLWSDGQAHWSGMMEFKQELAKLIPLQPTMDLGLGTGSDYFLARGEIELDGLVFHPTSLIARGQSGVRVLQRARGSD